MNLVIKDLEIALSNGFGVLTRGEECVRTFHWKGVEYVIIVEQDCMFVRRKDLAKWPSHDRYGQRGEAANVESGVHQ